MTYWSIHPQFDSDPRRNGKLRVLRHNTADGASQVIASNVKPDVAPLLAAAPDLLAALDDLATWTHALAVHGRAPPSAWKLLDHLHAQADAALNKAQGM